MARKFGREGHAVAIVARNADRLSGAAAALVDAGITAQAFPCDLGDTDAVRGLVRQVRASLGPIAVVHWNAYDHGAGDLTTAPVDELRASVGVSTFGLVAAVQEALPDLKTCSGAVLVTGGGLSFYDAQMDTLAVRWKAMGLAIAKAAQHKTAALLHARLAGEGVYVGEVVVLGLVKGSAFDTGHGTLDPAAIADRFWDLCQRRAEASVNFG